MAVGIISLASVAQTYTTKADGNWNSAATWVNGVIPSSTIGAGKIVNINHDVTFNLSSDLTISGTLNIENDTLRFGSFHDKKVYIQSTGLMYVKNGGFLQASSPSLSEMQISGGRLVLDNAKFSISKNIKALAGTRRSYKNSTVTVGDKYEMEGNSGSRSIDSIQASTITIGKDFDVKSYCTIRVSNAKVIVLDGDFDNGANSDITVLPGATNNFGFDVLKTKKDLDNDGAWDARIDAYCVDGNITGSNMAAIDFTRAEDCSLTTVNSGPAPEVVFGNPVLTSGTANQQGAVYRFANVFPGVDAEVKLKKFSRPDIVMLNVDLPSMGWGKAFQPQFGLPGLVQPFQNWYIDFEMTFYDGGTNNKRRMAKVDMTALDVDGDGNSISEYASFEAPSNVIYSTISYLNAQPAGLLGQSFVCPLDGVASALIACSGCGGDGKTGMWNIDHCTVCDGSGLLYSHNSYPYEGATGNTVSGPVENFLNIDTLATQVMATYQYVDKDRIRFRYGARSGALSSNGSGIRLNSLWFRQFSLAPPVPLPVKLSEFNAIYKGSDVSLNWTSQMEENFSHFIVQRSNDGKNYTDIATVLTNGSYGSGTKYEYKDRNVSSATGMNFYRIVCVDRTKEATYSVVRTIRLTKENAQTLALTTYPNPVTEQVKVTLPAAWQGKKVVLELYNANGVKVQGVQFSSASQTETMQIANVSTGFYLVKATCDGEVAQQRVIKN